MASNDPLEVLPIPLTETEFLPADRQFGILILFRHHERGLTRWL